MTPYRWRHGCKPRVRVQWDPGGRPIYSFTPPGAALPVLWTLEASGGWAVIDAHGGGVLGSLAAACDRFKIAFDAAG